MIHKTGEKPSKHCHSKVFEDQGKKLQFTVVYESYIFYNKTILCMIRF